MVHRSRKQVKGSKGAPSTPPKEGRVSSGGADGKGSKGGPPTPPEEPPLPLLRKEGRDGKGLKDYSLNLVP